MSGEPSDAGAYDPPATRPTSTVSMSQPANPWQAVWSFLIGCGLWMAGIGIGCVSRILANLIPGSGVIEPSRALAAFCATMLIVGLIIGYTVAAFQLMQAKTRRQLPVLAWHRLVEVATAMLAALGLTTLTRRRLALQVGAGLAAAVAAFLAAGLLAEVIDWSVPTEDPRDVIAARASTAAAALNGFIAAAPAEEMAYRGPLLFAVAALDRFRPGWPRICRLATIVTWLLTSVLFGLLHSNYGAYNVAAATVNGLIWGMVAIRARSIIPALIGHGTYNAIIFALQTL